MSFTKALPSKYLLTKTIDIETLLQSKERFIIKTHPRKLLKTILKISLKSEEEGAAIVFCEIPYALQLLLISVEWNLRLLQGKLLQELIIDFDGD